MIPRFVMQAVSYGGLLVLPGSSAATPCGAKPDGFTVRQLTPKAWLIESTVDIPGFGRVPCNNLLLAGTRDSVLLDALTTDALTDSVLDWAANELRRPVRELVVTHAHDDRIGGIAAAHRCGVASSALPLTCSLAQKGGWPPPRKEIKSGDSLQFQGLRIDFYFPGHGHTPDNLVVWIPSEKILYAGCFVKDAASRTIGNTSDANLAAWEKGVSILLKRFPEAEIVVPGHGAPGSLKLLQHTLSLIRDHIQTQSRPL